MGKIMSKYLMFILIFVLVFIVSVVLSLPLSWVLKQAQIKQQIPENITLHKPQGSWWKGNLSPVLKEGSESKKLGKLYWQLSWSDLLFAKVTANMRWVLNTGEVTGRISYSSDTIKITNLTGDMSVNEIMKLSDKTLILADATGQLHLHNLSFTLPTKDLWPSAIAGKLTLTRFSALGAEIDLLEATPILKKQEIYTKITGGQNTKGWNLIANTSLFKNHSFNMDIKVSATNANNMPDWVGLMLPMKNPKLAQMQRKGNWL